ncbi:MAG: hypothetical protein SFU56_20525 [Capsulimonadales bacterium]|nr:hypothetical protein [Capsulimonadales bacterium]
MSTQTEPLSEENIKAFAAAWYQALDFHAPEAEIVRFLATEDLKMIFPESTLEGLNDFLAWYRGGTTAAGNQLPGVINIFFDENHNVASVDARIEGDGAEVDVVVAWQASWFTPPAAKSKRTAMDATQHWTLRRTDRNEFGLEIVSYNAVVVPFQYAPGFARL